MTNADLMVFGFLLLSAIIGFFSGFEKQVKRFGKGIVGLAIVGFITFCYGGFILNLQISAGLVAELKEWLGGVASFLADGILFVLIEYILLFIVMSIALKLFLSLVGAIVGSTGSNGKTSWINRIFGAATSSLFAVCVVFVIFMLISIMPDNASAVDEIQRSLCAVFYNNNPFSLLFK